MPFFKERQIRVVPWFLGGADANPLDIFAWDSIKNALNLLPKDQFDAVPKIIAELRQSPAWLAALG